MLTKNYRPDIDGLRAIAVMLVVLYHAGLSWISGGFIGVDVFFVISGYLITGIIYDEIRAGSFSFKQFYIRRIRRIFPALYAMLAGSLIAAWFLLLPPHIEDFSNSLLSAIGFVSNFYFGSVTEGYFDSNAEASPLLHTWSLAVEEQFYLLWPPLLLLLYRFFNGARLLLLVLSIVAGSFYFAEVEALRLDDRAYYSILTRAGELLIGGLLAMVHRHYHLQLPRGTVNLAAVLGLVLIVVPALMLDEWSTFPGINALWPCLGAALLIQTGLQSNLINKHLIASRPMVAIGLISYSLYLWHWPILVYADYLLTERTTAVSVTCVALSFLAAFVSWRLIEQPLRTRWFPDFSSAIKTGVLVPCGVFALICGVLLALDGVAVRFDDKVIKQLEMASDGTTRARGDCFYANQAELPTELNCTLGAGEKKPEAILWGDSFANQLSGFFDELGLAGNFSLRDFTMGVCPPLIDTIRIRHKRGKICRDRNDNVIGFIRREEIKTVFMAGYWHRYLTTPDSYLVDDIDRQPSAENSRRAFRDGLMRTVEEVIAAGKQPVLVAMTPVFTFAPSDCVIKRIALEPSWKNDCTMSYPDYQQRMDYITKVEQEALQRFPQLQLILLDELICPGGVCQPHIDSTLLYLFGNDSHFNMPGSRALGRAYLHKYGKYSI